MSRFSRTFISKRFTSQQGVSLIELMISITMGLFIMAGVLQLFASSSQTSRTAEGASRIQENIRYAFKRIGDDIALAGSLGCLGHSSNNIRNSVVAVGNVPVVGAWNDFAGTFISGVNNDAADADVLDGTDTLILKYVDATTAQQVNALSAGGAEMQLTANADADNFSIGQIVAVGNCVRIYFAPAADVDGDDIDLDNGATVTLSPSRSVVFAYGGQTGAHRYFIGNSAGTPVGEVCNPDDNIQRRYCALFRETNNGDSQELVQGVHAMQIRYGVEDDWQETINNPDDFSSTVDRVEVQLAFNALDSAGQALERNVTRVFAVRNQR